MKRYRLIPVLLALLLLLCSCSPAASSAAKIELTDGSGQVLALDKPAQKIIAMMPSDVEILYALGAQDQIVAVGQYCDFPAEAADKPSVGTGENTSVEQLIALKPDLVIIGVMAQTAEQRESLAAAGVKVYVSDAQTISDAYGMIEALGAITGKIPEAAKLVADMKKGFEEIASNVSEKKTAYVEISPLEFGLYTCGTGTFIDELLGYAGLENAFGDLEGWPAISEEQIIARNPDVILTTSDGSFGPADPLAEIAARPGWDTLLAVQGGQVKMIDMNMSTRPGPRLVDAAKAMHDVAYGAQ